MTNERLSEILYISFCDFKNRNPYNTISNEEIDEAHKKLEELIERDTPKEPIFGTHKIIRSMGFFCPDCNLKVNQREHLYFCKCGQRLKWSE